MFLRSKLAMSFVASSSVNPAPPDASEAVKARSRRRSAACLRCSCEPIRVLCCESFIVVVGFVVTRISSRSVTGVDARRVLFISLESSPTESESSCRQVRPVSFSTFCVLVPSLHNTMDDCTRHNRPGPFADPANRPVIRVHSLVVAVAPPKVPASNTNVCGRRGRVHERRVLILTG